MPAQLRRHTVIRAMDGRVLNQHCAGANKTLINNINAIHYGSIGLDAGAIAYLNIGAQTGVDGNKTKISDLAVIIHRRRSLDYAALANSRARINNGTRHNRCTNSDIYTIANDGRRVYQCGNGSFLRLQLLNDGLSYCFVTDSHKEIRIIYVRNFLRLQLLNDGPYYSLFINNHLSFKRVNYT